jgi:hypothetical protein
MVSEYSTNDCAEKIMGRRRTDGISIDQPCELGYHCPVCEYPLTVDGDYDERLSWSEYNGFLWCEVCNKDYPSALCQPDIDRAIGTFLDTIEGAKVVEWEDWLVGIGYPFVCVYDPSPPITRKALAEAWHRADPQESIDDWLAAIEMELGLRTEAKSVLE